MIFINIYDISQKSGVSIATVSRVLNNSSNVSEKTRKKVLAIIEETGYTPNVFARGLGLNSMSIIGIMCSNSSDSFLASAIYMLEQGLRAHNYDCLLCCTGYEKSNKEKYLGLLLSKRVDAIILVGSDFIDTSEDNNKYIIEASKKIPVVLLNGQLDAPNIYSVRCDDTQIVCDVTKAQLQNGIENILYLNRRMSFGATLKIAGFKKAHSELNIPLEPWQIKTFHGEMDEIFKVLDGIPNKFNCVITSDDELAISVIKYAKSKNLNIPNDISIIGYNNSKFSIYCEPELSSIDNKLQYCCSNVVSVVTNILTKENPPLQTIISAEFIKRNTSK